jgi:hypothetical protein
MSQADVRFYLSTIWIGSFALSVAVLGAIYSMGWIRVGTLTDQLENVVKLYAPYVGLVLAYYFAARKRDGGVVSTDPIGLLAMLTSVMWNLPVVLLIARHLVPTPCTPGENCLADSVAVATKAGQYLAFLVAPALGVYFGKKS